MARKLYGAAARAHSKRLKRSKRRRNPSKKTVRRRPRRNPGTKAGGIAAARTRESMRLSQTPAQAAAAKRSRAAKKAARTRIKNMKAKAAAKPRKKKKKAKARKTAARKPSKRKKKTTARAAAPKRRRRHHGGGRPSSAKSMRRARRTIRNRYKRPGARSYMRRYHMRSNPSSIKDFAMILLPVAAGLYGSRLLTGKFGGQIPGLNKIPAAYRGPAVAGAILVGTHFATKKIGALGKYRTGLMIGTGLNFLDRMLAAFAPGVAGQIGVGNDGIGDYVQIGDYMQVGATPIDDDITLSDYFEVGAEEELGLDEELGLNEELGASTGLSRAYLGGVSQSSMMKQIPSRPMFEAIPSRSFTKQIPDAGSNFDSSADIYGGIFGGGF